MKKRIFLASLLFTSLSNAQSLTQANEPVIGNTVTMYSCNTSFSNYSSTTGTGITWDFSGITAVTGSTTKVVSVAAPDTTCYPSATKMTKIPGFISNYWASTATERTSHGFIFNDVTLGKIVVKFNVDQENVVTYPFAFAGVLTDTYSGLCFNNSLTSPQGSSCTGNIEASIDGQGTLILPGHTSILNVIRHKVVETTSTTFLYMMQNIPATITRTQYDYYSTTGSNKLPIFSHISVNIVAGIINNTVVLVLSSVNPVGASLDKIDENNFSIFPNPTEGLMTITGDFSSEASLIVTDQAGRVVSSMETLTNGSKIDLTSVEKGIYFVVISDKGVKTTKAVSLK